MTGISIVVATLGREELLSSNLRHAVAQRPPPLELIVVDGDERCSARPAVEVVRASTSVPVRYVTSRRGLTAQRNRGLEVAQGDVVLFLDDDARMEPGVLDALAQAYHMPEVVGATGRVIEPASHRLGAKSSPVRRLLFARAKEGRFTRFGYPRRLVDEGLGRDVEFMPGCFMSVRSGLGRSERFDERLQGYGLAEDEDFSFRISRHGRIVYLPHAVVIHDNRGFHTRDRRAFGKQVVVNRHYLFRKNFAPTPLAKAQFALLVVVLIAHRMVNRDLSGMRGLLDGVREVAHGGELR